MELTTVEVAGCPVLRLSGRVTRSDGPRLQAALGQAIASGPDCVVCDLARVAWLDSACMSVFTAAHWSSPWAGPVIWLTGATGAVAGTIHGMGADRFLAFAGNVADALAARNVRTPLLQESTSLGTTPRAPRQARVFVTETLRKWHLSGVADDAALIVSELVTNAVVRARADLQVVLEQGHGLLRIAVQDSRPGLTQQPWQTSLDGSGGDEHDRRLTIVRELATGFGQDILPDGRKSVWASMRTDPMAAPFGLQPEAPSPTAGAVVESIVVEDGRPAQVHGAGWSVRLDLEWRPTDPDHVTIVLRSSPAHPALPRGQWRVERSLLERGLNGAATCGPVELRPEAMEGYAIFTLGLGRPSRTARVPLDPIHRFLERTSRSDRTT